MTAVSTTTFDERALGSLPEAPAFVSATAGRGASERFDAMPVPSQETEEWRYTDLSAFELDFLPFADGGGPEDRNRHELLSSAGAAGERAGLQIQRNSTVLSTQRSAALTDRGVWFGSLDEASETHPELVEPYLHQLVPAGRTKFTALHAAFRTGGTFLHVPARHRDRAPDPDAHLPRRRRRRRLPAHARRRRSGLRGHVHRPLREPGSRAGRSATRSPRSTSATAPTCATSRSRSGGAA